MNIHEIAHLPTRYDRVSADIGVHESIFRAYRIVQKVKDLLGRGCPNDILLELIEVMEWRPPGGGPPKEAENE